MNISRVRLIVRIFYQTLGSGFAFGLLVGFVYAAIVVVANPILHRATGSDFVMLEYGVFSLFFGSMFGGAMFGFMISLIHGLVFASYIAYRPFAEHTFRHFVPIGGFLAGLVYVVWMGLVVQGSPQPLSISDVINGIVIFILIVISGLGVGMTVQAYYIDFLSNSEKKKRG